MEESQINKNPMIGFDHFVPGQSIDCVIIGYQKEELYALILKWKNVESWALPGGFINRDEDMDSAAIHILKDRTGLNFPYLDQFFTFGNVSRSGYKPDSSVLKNIHGFVDIEALKKWFDQRFITTGYFALVDINKCAVQPDFLSDKCEWHPLKSLPNLMMDHKKIIDKALELIKIRVNYLPIGITLLPELFTMKDLQKLYEAILEKELDRGNFQKKMLKLGIFIRQEKQLTGAANKAPYLYKFDRNKYEEMLVKGIGFTL